MSLKEILGIIGGIGGITGIGYLILKLINFLKLVTGKIKLNCNIEMIDKEEFSTDITKLRLTLHNPNFFKFKFERVELEPICETESDDSQKPYCWKPMSNIYSLDTDKTKTIDFFHEMGKFRNINFQDPEHINVKIIYTVIGFKKTIRPCCKDTRKLWNDSDTKSNFLKGGIKMTNERESDLNLADNLKIPEDLIELWDKDPKDTEIRERIKKNPKCPKQLFNRTDLDKLFD